MSNDLALYLSKQLLWHALLISSPIVLAVLISGLLVSILQSITQIQDATINLVPKLLVATLMLMLCGEWMLRHLVQFAQALFLNIPEAIQP